ncbi:MAG: hypothetical protein ABW133_11260, partial [Polyangiaceae bacterium]
MRRFFLLGRFLIARSSGVHALRRGLPLYFAIGIAATIIFARQGLDARTVVRGAATSLPVRVTLLVAWLVAAYPVARTVVTTPENTFLRALPIPRWQILIWLALLLFIAELPWAILWTRGGGPLVGAAATMSAMALHVFLLQPNRKDIDGAALLDRAWMMAVVMGWTRLGTDYVPLGSPFAMLALTGLASAGTVSSLRRAWQFAPERGAPRSRGPIAGAPARALASAYLRVLERRHAAALIRALLVVVAAMGWIGIALHNDATLAAQGTRTV